MKKLVAMLAVLSVASVASADLRLEVEMTNLGVNDFNGDPLVKYDLYFRGDTPGQAMAGFVGSFTGPLHQQWYFSGGSPFGETIHPDDFTFFTGIANYPHDTHLWLNSDGYETVGEGQPHENAVTWDPGFGGTGVNNGYGTWFANTADSHMVMAIKTANQTTNLYLMQIVTTSGATVLLNGEAAASNQADLPNGQKLVFDDYQIIPEPATIGLLVLGGVGALVRRRRR